MKFLCCCRSLITLYLQFATILPHNSSYSRRGTQVKPNTMSYSFKKMRDLSGLKWENGTPPSFHEIRSLAARLYKAQNMNAKDILGHKSQSQTDRYIDTRGKEWTIVTAL
ncbi:tyrosine-type recombinase/integrase [Yersinia kristensenii]|uniref:tyrosine-type recombinase/integrase n=1 Tax=Yersinia kristensenii TaxID=28152 RepID=UPI0023EAE125|nr:tyrosine-type recombinase/integrase [Yersinia kristensenii]